MSNESVLLATYSGNIDSGSSGSAIGVTDYLFTPEGTVTTTTQLATGQSDPAINLQGAGTPGAVSVDTARQAYFIADAGPMAQEAEIFRASLQGGIAPIPVYTSGTTLEIASGDYLYINGLAVDGVAGQLYFTQTVLDGLTGSPVENDTGIFRVAEDGGTPIPVVLGLSNPNVLALDVPDNLVFFTDSTGSGLNAAEGSSVNNLDVANLTTGSISVLLSEPYVPDAVYGPGSYGGRALNGIALDLATHTLYYTTDNPYNSPTSDGIYDVPFTVSGSGATATALIGISDTLYSGTASFAPAAISIDPASGHLYVVGMSKARDTADGGYTPGPQSIYEGSLTAADGSMLTSFTAPGTAVGGVALDAVPSLSAGGTVGWEPGSLPVTIDSSVSTGSATAPDYAGATISISNWQSGDLLAAATEATGIAEIYGDGTLTLSGVAPSSVYQRVLESTTYSSSAPDPTFAGAANSRIVNYVVTDGVTRTAPQTSTVDVRLAPSVVAGGDVSYLGGSGPIASDGSISIYGGSVPNLVSATISISSGMQIGDTLSTLPEMGISTHYNPNTGVLTLLGDAPSANYEAALQAVEFEFTPPFADPTAGGADLSRTLTYVVSDGVGSSTPVTSTVTVQHAPPSVTANEPAVFVTGGPSIVIDPACTVNAPDSSGLITSATIAIVSNLDPSDILSPGRVDGLTSSYNPANGRLSLSGVAAASTYQDVISSVLFTSSTSAGLATREITYSVNDGTMSSPTTAGTLTVQEPQPTITGLASSLEISDQQPITPFDGVTVADSSGQLVGATITLSPRELSAGTNGVLSGPGLDSGLNGVFSLGLTTPSDISQSLRALVFTPTAHQVAPGTTVSTNISLSVTDSGGGTAVRTSDVVATAAADPPAITGLLGSQVTTGSAIHLFSAAIVLDPDVNVSPEITIVSRRGGMAEDATGSLSGPGLIETQVGTYSLVGSPSTLTSELEAITFVPTRYQIGAGQTVATEIDVVAMADGLSSGASAMWITSTDVPCYCAGTRITTVHGEVAVEDLSIGDHVVTWGGALQPIRWIGRRAYKAESARLTPRVWPVLIRAGAIADGVPRRDLFVSQEHALYVGGFLVPAAHLVNGRSVLIVQCDHALCYLHLELASHEIIFAEGAAAETFVDDESVDMFDNADQYRALFSAKAPQAAHFYAPRVEDGKELESVRRLIEARLTPVEQTGPAAAVSGYLDHVGRESICGWAQDGTFRERPMKLRVSDNGVTIANVVADQYRPDLEQAGIGNGCYGFALTVPGGLSPTERHIIEVVAAKDGQPLGNSPRVLEPSFLRTPPAAPRKETTMNTLRGHVDVVTRHRISGWAQDMEGPHLPVALQIVDNGSLLARLLANRHRLDLEQAGIGCGRHSFDFIVPGGLSPIERHVIHVVRESDGVMIGGPAVIEPEDAFTGALEDAVDRAVGALESSCDQERVLSFILRQADRLRQMRADDDAGSIHRIEDRRRRRRGKRRLEEGRACSSELRALVVDELVPVSGRDGGSEAVLSHMRAIQHLGFAVSFVAAQGLETSTQLLKADGIECLGNPFYLSVEDVLRRQAGCFDLIYLHRAEIAARYLYLSRSYSPRARIVYSVADLHHLRLEGQATVEGRPELRADSRRMRVKEITLAEAADAVITHSESEADLLRRAAPQAHVHCVAWDVPACRVTVPYASRTGIAFIGNYRHVPNVDAVRWLVEAVMPIVLLFDPSITCMLVGSDMPDAVRSLARPSVFPVGHVDNLSASVFNRVRLTVAPLRFGAGVKCKVIESLAAGVPCVMTEIAANGLLLPGSLQTLVGRDAAEFAAIICRLHNDEARHLDVANAGSSFVAQRFTPEAVAADLREAITQNGGSRGASLRLSSCGNSGRQYKLKDVCAGGRPALH